MTFRSLHIGAATLIVLATTVVLLAPATSASTSASRRAARCPSLTQAPSLPRWPGGGTARGDVDGNGYRERGSIRYAPGALSTCGFFLVVQTRHGALAVRVHESDLGKGGAPSSIRRWSYPEPEISTVVQLGGAKSQFVVGLWHGASTFFFSLYGIDHGKLAVLPFHYGKGDVEPLHSTGGFASSSSTVRCTRGRTMTDLRNQAISPTRLRFDQLTWRLGRGGFRLTKTHSTIGGIGIYALEDRAGFNKPAFTGCTVPQGTHP
jgi:hypothetical protein